MAETLDYNEIIHLENAIEVLNSKGEYGISENIHGYVYDHRCYDCNRPLNEKELEASEWDSDPLCDTCLECPHPTPPDLTNFL